MEDQKKMEAELLSLVLHLVLAFLQQIVPKAVLAARVPDKLGDSDILPDCYVQGLSGTAPASRFAAFFVFRLRILHLALVDGITRPGWVKVA